MSEIRVKDISDGKEYRFEVSERDLSEFREYLKRSLKSGEETIIGEDSPYYLVSLLELLYSFDDGGDLVYSLFTESGGTFLFSGENTTDVINEVKRILTETLKEDFIVEDRRRSLKVTRK